MVLLQGIVIGRALMDAMREKTVQRATHTASMYTRNRHRAMLSKLRRRAVAPSFDSVFDNDLRLARLGGTSARRNFQTSTACHQHSAAEAAATGGIKFDDSDFSNTKWKNIYRMTKIRQLALVSQAKLSQTFLTCVVVPAVHYQYYLNLVTVKEIIFADSVMVFALGMLVAMSFYLRRFIGVVAISDDLQWIRVAHMNFWGRRVNTYIPVEDVIPLSDLQGTQSVAYISHVCRYSTQAQLFMLLHPQLCSVEHANHFRLVFGDTPLTKNIDDAAATTQSKDKEKTE